MSKNGNKRKTNSNNKIFVSQNTKVPLFGQLSMEYLYTRLAPYILSFKPPLSHCHRKQGQHYRGRRVAELNWSRRAVNKIVTHQRLVSVSVPCTSRLRKRRQVTLGAPNITPKVTVFTGGVPHTHFYHHNRLASRLFTPQTIFRFPVKL